MTTNISEIIKIENLVNDKLYAVYKKKSIAISQSKLPTNVFYIRNSSTTIPVKIMSLRGHAGMIIKNKETKSPVNGTVIQPMQSIPIEISYNQAYLNTLSSLTNIKLRLEVEEVKIPPTPTPIPPTPTPIPPTPIPTKYVISWTTYGTCIVRYIDSLPDGPPTSCLESNKEIKYENYIPGEFGIEGGWRAGSREVVTYCKEHTEEPYCTPDRTEMGLMPPSNANVIRYSDGTIEERIPRAPRPAPTVVPGYAIHKTVQFSSWFNGEDNIEMFESRPPAGWVQCPIGGAYYRDGSNKAIACLSQYKVDPSREWALKMIRPGTVDEQEYITTTNQVYELPSISNDFKEGTYTYTYGYKVNTVVSPLFDYVPIVDSPTNPKPRSPERTTIVTRTPLEGNILLRKVFVSGPTVVYGCTDTRAENYNAFATRDDGTCKYITNIVRGCTDPNASNYNPHANENDGTCLYSPVIIYGCIDSRALNYNPGANKDNGSCIFGGSGGSSGSGNDDGDDGGDDERIQTIFMT